jgi:putative methylase
MGSMKKKALEMVLSQIPANPSPIPQLEQYITPVNIASDVLFLAHLMGDIEDKSVIDLGCGTGIFAIGAKLLGAKEVIGIDVDDKAIRVAREAAKKLEAMVDFRVCEINDFNKECDCVLQNPPFGAQKRHADRPFIIKALDISNVIYSLHLAKTQTFIEKEVKKLNATVTHTQNFKFEIKHTFDFHTNEKKFFDVMMFRIERSRGL